MKKKLVVYLLLASLLGGCGKKPDAKDDTATQQTETDASNLVFEDDGTKTLRERGCVLAANSVDGYDNLYQVDTSFLGEYTYIFDIAVNDGYAYIIAQKEIPEAEIPNYNPEAENPEAEYADNNVDSEYDEALDFYDYDVAVSSDFFCYDTLTGEVINQIELLSGDYTDNSIVIDNDGNIGLVNLSQHQLTIYDKELNVLRVADLPNDTYYSYVLASDFSTLYYCEEEKYYAYDVNLGEKKEILCDIDRLEDGYASVLGVNTDDNIIIVTSWSYVENEGYCKFYSLSDETLVKQYEYEGISYEASNQQELLRMSVDGSVEILFSAGDDELKALTFENYVERDYVSMNINAQMVATAMALDMDQEKGTHYMYSLYDLLTGKKQYALELDINPEDDTHYPNRVSVDQKNDIAILELAYMGKTSLFVWDLREESSLNKDTTNYLVAFDDIINLTGSCEKQLDETRKKIENKYEIEIFYGDDLEKSQETYYALETVKNYSLIMNALQTLDKTLERYPRDMIPQMNQMNGGKLRFYFCGKMSPVGEDAISSAAGLKSFDDNIQTIIMDIKLSYGLESTIYHELFHAIESSLWIIDAFPDDTWFNLNPSDFVYDCDYTDNEENYDGSYTTYEDSSENIYFIDTYSKVFPNEDRARIIEYAMIDEKNQYNYYRTNEHLREKLQWISDIIRAGFDTTNWPEKTAWEKAME